MLYLDGKFEAAVDASSSAEVSDMSLIIGRHSLASGWLGRPFSGRIDELAIYDRALSAEEVRSHFDLAN